MPVNRSTPGSRPHRSSPANTRKSSRPWSTTTTRCREMSAMSRKPCTILGSTVSANEIPEVCIARLDRARAVDHASPSFRCAAVSCVQSTASLAENQCLWGVGPNRDTLRSQRNVMDSYRGTGARRYRDPACDDRGINAVASSRPRKR